MTCCDGRTGFGDAETDQALCPTGPFVPFGEEVGRLGRAVLLHRKDVPDFLHTKNTLPTTREAPALVHRVPLSIGVACTDVAPLAQTTMAMRSGAILRRNVRHVTDL